MNHLPVVFCMDRAGYVGDDGAVHHGFMDQAFLRPMPGMVLMAPSDEAELNRSLRLALSLESPGAIRYPRDNVPACNFEDVIDARFCKPVDGEMLARVLKTGQPVLTVEDHSLQNGFGTAVLEYAANHALPTEQITRLGMPDRLVAHATRKEQLAEVGLDPTGIASSVRDAVRRAQKSSPLALLANS